MTVITDWRETHWGVAMGRDQTYELRLFVPKQDQRREQQWL